MWILPHANPFMSGTKLYEKREVWFHMLEREGEGGGERAREMLPHFWMRRFLDVGSEEDVLLPGPLDLRI